MIEGYWIATTNFIIFSFSWSLRRRYLPLKKPLLVIIVRVFGRQAFQDRKVLVRDAQQLTLTLDLVQAARETNVEWKTWIIGCSFSEYYSAEIKLRSVLFLYYQNENDSLKYL